MIGLPLEFVGDDGLTQRFFDSLKTKIESSPDFVLTASDNFKINILIAGNLFWAKGIKGVRFNVVVVFTDNEGKFIGVHNAPCLEREMDSCADIVVAEALKHMRQDP